MYPMQELNRLVLMPTLDMLSPNAWGCLPPSAQLFVACGFAAGGTTFVLLPYARSFTEAIGLMGGSAKKGAQGAPPPPPPPLWRPLSQLALAYVLLMGVGVIASHAATASAPYSVQRLGKLTPPYGSSNVASAGAGAAAADDSATEDGRGEPENARREGGGLGLHDRGVPAVRYPSRGGIGAAMGSRRERLQGATPRGPDPAS
jgi:hypothetical protein